MSFGPYSGLYFLFYEMLKERAADFSAQDYLRKVSMKDESGRQAARKQDLRFAQAMFCSMQAGVAAAVITNPLDLAKLRMQVQRAGKIGGGDKS